MSKRKDATKLKACLGSTNPATGIPHPLDISGCVMEQCPALRKLGKAHFSAKYHLGAGHVEVTLSAERFPGEAANRRGQIKSHLGHQGQAEVVLVPRATGDPKCRERSPQDETGSVLTNARSRWSGRHTNAQRRLSAPQCLNAAVAQQHEKLWA